MVWVGGDFKSHAVPPLPWTPPCPRLLQGTLPGLQGCSVLQSQLRFPSAGMSGAPFGSWMSMETLPLYIPSRALGRQSCWLQEQRFQCQALICGAFSGFGQDSRQRVIPSHSASFCELAVLMFLGHSRGWGSCSSAGCATELSSVKSTPCAQPRL